MKMLKAWLAVLGLALSLNAFAQYPAAGGDDKYQPRLGQEGKDVIWMPTGGELVTLMLKTAKVAPNDLVYDLGAGDVGQHLANFAAMCTSLCFLRCRHLKVAIPQIKLNTGSCALLLGTWPVLVAAWGLRLINACSQTGLGSMTFRPDRFGRYGSVFLAA
jgi:hypothetical protein